MQARWSSRSATPRLLLTVLIGRLAGRVGVRDRRGMSPRRRDDARDGAARADGLDARRRRPAAARLDLGERFGRDRQHLRAHERPQMTTVFRTYIDLCPRCCSASSASPACSRPPAS